MKWQIGEIVKKVMHKEYTLDWSQSEVFLYTLLMVSSIVTVRVLYLHVAQVNVLMR